MRKRPHRLDAVKQAHVNAVTAAAGGSEAALAQLRGLLPQLTALPSSAITFDVDAESKQEDQRVLLGSGNYAEVFAGSVKMEEEGEANPCAIKRLSVDKGLRAERLLQEALTMSKCQDEEQPLLLAVALGDGHFYLVLDRLELTLQQYVKERHPSPTARCRLLLRCAELLRRAHDRRVSHNDIKAPNFLMSEDGSRMVLCDFGFAVHPDLQYLPAKVRGTWKFFAPELSLAAKRGGQPSASRTRTSPRSEASRMKTDSFSFGALIQEVVIGEPYVGIDRNKWLSVSAFRQEKLAKAVGVWPAEYGWGLKELMERCGLLRPADRPSISEICATLRHIVERAEEAEAEQPEAAHALPSALGSRRRVVVEEDSQLSEELDSEGAEIHAESGADGASPGSDHETESGEFDGNDHTDQMEDEEGLLPCPKCSDRLRTEKGLSGHSRCHVLVSQKKAAKCDLCRGIFRSRRAMRLHRQRCSQRAQLHTAVAQSSRFAPKKRQRRARVVRSLGAPSGIAALPVAPAIQRGQALQPQPADSDVQMAEAGAGAAAEFPCPHCPVRFTMFSSLQRHIHGHVAADEALTASAPPAADELAEAQRPSKRARSEQPASASAAPALPSLLQAGSHHEAQAAAAAGGSGVPGPAYGGSLSALFSSYRNASHHRVAKKIHRCSRCHDRFNDESALQSHLEDNHAAVGEAGHPCPGCPSVFRNPTYQKKHKARCAVRRQRAEKQYRQQATRFSLDQQPQSAKGAVAVDSLEPTTTGQSSQQSAAEGGQRHDRQVGADHNASGAAAVPLLPPIDPAILRELAAQPEPPDSDVQMAERGARADISADVDASGHNGRDSATPSSVAPVAGQQSNSAGATSDQQGPANEVKVRGAKQPAGGADPTPAPARVQSQSAEPQPAASSSGGAALAAAGVQGRLAAQLVAQFLTGDSSSRAPFIEAFWTDLPTDFKQMLGLCVASSSPSQSAEGAGLRSLPDPSVHASTSTPPLMSGAQQPTPAHDQLMESAEEASLTMLSDAAAQVDAMGDERKQSDEEADCRQSAPQTKRKHM